VLPSDSLNCDRTLVTRAAVAAIAIAALLLLVLGGPAHAVRLATESATASTAAARNELTAGKAAILGLVEGLTEYLPISSTGHLLVAEKILDVGATKQTKDAADTYLIVIQAGAILAVLLLFWRRIIEIVRGLFGKSEEGRRLLVALVVAFIPAALVGIVGEKAIKNVLLKPIPVAIAWIAGAILIFVVAAPLYRNAKEHGRPLGAITTRNALIIGGAQVLALWPGVSRSLVTIVAALLVGLTMPAAVEFSFLLGLMTLGAATLYDGAKHGHELVDTYGVANPLLGFVVAFVAAVLAVRWMVTYLQRHDLTIFAWFRLAAAAITIVLVVSGTISA